MNPFARLICLASAVLLTVNLTAQGRSRGALPLKPGDALPNVSGFAEDGTVLRLADLKGQPTVIAFGCLT